MRISRRDFLVGGVAATAMPMLAKPTKGALGAEREGGRTLALPYDAEVEYLESTGTQWIDTGVVEASPSNFAITINKISGSFSFGFCHANVTSGTWLGMRSYLGKAYYKSYYDTVSFSDDEPIYFKWDGSKGFYINGIKVGSFTASVGSDSISACSWPVFGMRDFAYALAVNNIYSCKIGQITIWQSGTLVRDMIPVRFTNELGQSEGAMYDRVSGQLLRNQGSGNFVVGPDKR